MSDTHFPVCYSTLRTDVLMSHVLTRYPIGEVLECRMWNRGLSDVYLVKTVKQQYVLRVSQAHWRLRSDIEFEMALLVFLRQRHIPVSYPLETDDSQQILEINAPEGQRFATLMTYAPGEIALGDFNLAQSQMLGRTLAKLHIATTDFHTSIDRQPLDFDHLVDQSLSLILPHVRSLSTIDVLKATRHQLHAALRSLPQEAPFWVICWGDPHSGNVHCTADQQMTLFDFDQCGYGWRSFDIAKFLQMALCTGMRYSVRDAFLAGYQDRQPLTEEEIVALRPLTQVAHLWRWGISVNHALIHDYSRLDNFYFRHRVEQLKMLNNYDWQALQQQARKPAGQRL